MRTAGLGLALTILGISASDAFAVPQRQPPVAIPLAAGPLETQALEDISAEERENNIPIEETLEEQSPPRPYAPLRPSTTCPTDIETLTALIIRDIPNYTNRELQRSIAALPGNDVDGRAPYRPSHVLIAGRPELEPLDLRDYSFTTDPEAGGQLTQLFFTTLSRQYSGLRSNEVQEYHWLFLTQASDGWRLAFMFSAIDDAESIRAALPPRESSEGTVGKAVQLWLRDCRAGSIYPLGDRAL